MPVLLALLPFLALYAKAAVPVEFTRDIEPILRVRCQGCHGAALQSSGLRLDNPKDALAGGYSGAVIRPGNSAESRLIHMVAAIQKGEVMPPKGPRLTPEQVGILRAWIDQGAEYPDALSVTVTRRRDHWAFKPPQRPPLPAPGCAPAQSFARSSDSLRTRLSSMLFQVLR